MLSLKQIFILYYLLIYTVKLLFYIILPYLIIIILVNSIIVNPESYKSIAIIQEISICRIEFPCNLNY